jgi:hypothetical protein
MGARSFADLVRMADLLAVAVSPPLAGKIGAILD